mmetsp:Transcript_17463/g.38180  ORF Transcript_17463/g.38180 Transcript_17463/m.38180 type:complete len:195 (-) Transcript_17463:13-597(-)
MPQLKSFLVYKSFLNLKRAILGGWDERVSEFSRIQYFRGALFRCAGSSTAHYDLLYYHLIRNLCGAFKSRALARDLVLDGCNPGLSTSRPAKRLKYREDLPADACNWCRDICTYFPLREAMGYSRYMYFMYCFGKVGRCTSKLIVGRLRNERAAGRADKISQELMLSCLKRSIDSFETDDVTFCEEMEKQYVDV